MPSKPPNHFFSIQLIYKTKLLLFNRIPYRKFISSEHIGKIKLSQSPIFMLSKILILASIIQRLLAYKFNRQNSNFAFKIKLMKYCLKENEASNNACCKEKIV